MILALTGATGFVGSTVLDVALNAGHRMQALTRKAQPERSGVAWVRGDLASADALHRLCEGCDAVIHVAGVVNAAHPSAFHAGNVAGTEAMIAAARACGVNRFVHVSSLAARQPALSHYGASKHGGEGVVADSGLHWTIVRPPAIYGPGDTEMFELFKAARTGFVPLPPPGRTSLIHAADLADLLVTLATDPMTGRGGGFTYDVDDGRDGGWSHAEMARAIGTAMGRNVRPVHVPRGVLRLAARTDRLLRGARAKLTPDRVGYMTHPDWVAEPAKRPPADLWKPQIATPEGLRQTADWYRQQGWL